MVSIPVIANGDICTHQEAGRVLEYTSADGIMIGRAAQGNPWIFREIAYYLNTGKLLQEPDTIETRQILVSHLESLYDFYGKHMGVRIARKHIGWYCRNRQGSRPFLALVNQAESSEEQLKLVWNFFSQYVDGVYAA